MQVSVENTGGLERKLTVQVPGDEIDSKVASKLRELARTVRIKGFRPGRVPMSVVRQRYGKAARQEIVGETVQATLQQAIASENLRVASRPRLDSPPQDKDNGDVEFSAVVEVYPDIAQIDAAALEIERPEAVVNDTDVEEMLQTLREQRQTWEQVERTAEDGDQVIMEFAAESDDGRVPEEGTKRMSVVLGKSGFDKLEKALAKIPAGESKKVTLEFPEGFNEAKLAGKKAKAELKVVRVSQPKLPELDEAFIKTFGIESGDLDELKSEIRDNLERELKNAATSLLKVGLVDQLIKAVPDLEVPASVVRDEAASMAAQLLSQQGHQPDQALVQQLAASFTEPAEKRVRAGLLMGELAHQNGIRVDSNKVRSTIEAVASTYEEPSEVIQLYYGNPNLLQQVESSVLEEQVVDWALENAKVTPKEMSFQDVIAGATRRASE
jgi:trigger factor